MKSLTANWKTTATGIITLAITAIKIFYPSILTMQVYIAILGVLGGLGLVAAKDGNITGGTTPQ